MPVQAQFLVGQGAPTLPPKRNPAHAPGENLPLTGYKLGESVTVLISNQKLANLWVVCPLPSPKFYLFSYLFILD